MSTAIEVLDADLVPAGINVNSTGPCSGLVKSVVIGDELVINPQLRAIVTFGAESPDSGGWNIDKAGEDGCDVVVLSTGQDIAITNIAIDVGEHITHEWLSRVDANISKLAP
jgi:hypothetical protein